MSNKKKNVIISLIILLCVIGISQTLAYTTSSVETENIITFGNLKLKIVETVLNETGEEIPFSPEEPVDITKKESVSRIVKVENVGQQPMFVRVELNITGTDKDGNTVESAKELADYNINEEYWLYDNGWYYYTGILEPGTQSEELITEVMFDTNQITNNYPGGSFHLEINAQAVQSKNNGTNVIEASGWPEE